MTDEEIVKFVNSEDTQEPENNEESESLIKVKDALEGLANVVKYVQHNNLGGVDFVTMKTLNSLSIKFFEMILKTSTSLALSNTFSEFCSHLPSFFFNKLLFNQIRSL